jgi:hypothetical protein
VHSLTPREENESARNLPFARPSIARHRVKPLIF